VTIRADGYAAWARTNVRVNQEPVCRHVITQFVTAQLQPS
jgi:hypothetical protein